MSAAMSDPVAGAVPGPALWTQIPLVGAGAVVRQSDENGCGPACGEMLFQDRGIIIPQSMISLTLPLPVTGGELASRMSVLAELAWLGGALDLAEEPTWDLVACISASQRSWAALLEPHGPRHVGHWVVIDDVSRERLVLVRDPVGRAYGIPMMEFLSLWRCAVVVMEKVAP